MDPHMTSATRIFATALSLSFLLGSTALAQEAEAPAADAPAAAAEGEQPAAGADALSLGAEVAAPDGPGTTYTAASFDSWEQRCMRTVDGSDPCQLYQLLKDAQGTSVAEISLFPLPAGQQAVAGATIVAPLETLLTEQLTLAVDGATPKRYPFTWCAPLGCIARVGFTQAEIDGFKKGAKATMTIVPVAAPDQKVVLDISLKGFTAGFDAVAKTPAP
jgi:invasion protein IalB